MPDPTPAQNPQVVINVPSSAPAPPAEAASPVDPTVRYLMEQATAAVQAGADAAPAAVAKVEQAVSGYGTACLCVSGAYFGLTLAVLLFVRWVWTCTFQDAEAEGWARFAAGLAGGVLCILLVCIGVSWLSEGAVAYFAPLVWVASKIAAK
jgi:hypothetical protein